MLIASKMEEVYPLKIKTVFEKIAHKKVPQSEIVKMEERILNNLDFTIKCWTIYDEVMLILNKKVHEKPKGQSILAAEDNTSVKIEEQISILEDLCSYLCKFVYYDY